MFSRLAVVTAVAFACGGCGTALEGKKVDYKSARTVSGLDIPPDLTNPSGDNRYAVSGDATTQSATFSAYKGTQQAAPAAAPPPVAQPASIRVERNGNQRWLVVKESQEKLLPLVKGFWQEMGFIINLDVPEAGIIETDWAENRARIPESGIRKVLARVLDTVYSTAERDKFRTRFEAGSEPGTIEVYVSHRGVIEVVKSTRDGTTLWQPRPADPELEAEMLQRLLVHLGTEQSQAAAQIAAPARVDRAAIARGNDGQDRLDMRDPFDLAWRRVGLALDRIGFTVEDRDRQQGLYFVRFVDDKGDVEGKGFFDKLAFWRDDDAGKPRSEQFRIRLDRSVAELTRVEVLDAAGKTPNASASSKIVSLLHAQLR